MFQLVSKCSFSGVIVKVGAVVGGLEEALAAQLVAQAAVVGVEVSVVPVVVASSFAEAVLAGGVKAQKKAAVAVVAAAEAAALDAKFHAFA